MMQHVWITYFDKVYNIVPFLICMMVNKDFIEPEKKD